MMIKLVILLALCALTNSQQYQGKTPEGMHFFHIDLSLPVELRFPGTAKLMKKEIEDLIWSFGYAYPAHVQSLFQKYTWTIEHFQPEYLNEIKSMAEASGVNYQSLVTMNYILEIHSYCTSIVGKDSKGFPFLCRNADFLNEGALRKASYVAKFFHGDTYLYDAVMLAGCSGTFTASKNGKFAMSINLRVPQQTFTGFLENMAFLFLGSKQPTWIVREAMI